VQHNIIALYVKFVQCKNNAQCAIQIQEQHHKLVSALGVPSQTSVYKAVPPVHYCPAEGSNAITAIHFPEPGYTSTSNSVLQY